MKPERPSNYDVTRDSMEREFARYDQKEMIRKFSLPHDSMYLYIRFLGRDYRIDRTSGRVEWYEGRTNRPVHAGFNESMTIFDVLAWSKPGCHLSHRFVPLGDLPNTTQSASTGGNVFSGQGRFFAGRCAELAAACARLGGAPGDVGDVSAVIPLFDFLPVMLQFWDGDEEFPPVLKLMWDYNTTDFMHFETAAFATGHIVSRLKEFVEELS